MPTVRLKLLPSSLFFIFVKPISCNSTAQSHRSYLDQKFPKWHWKNVGVCWFIYSNSTADHIRILKKIYSINNVIIIFYIQQLYDCSDWTVLWTACSFAQYVQSIFFFSVTFYDMRAIVGKKKTELLVEGCGQSNVCFNTLSFCELKEITLHKHILRFEFHTQCFMCLFDQIWHPVLSVKFVFWDQGLWHALVEGGLDYKLYHKTIYFIKQTVWCFWTTRVAAEHFSYVPFLTDIFLQTFNWMDKNKDLK